MQEKKSVGSSALLRQLLAEGPYSFPSRRFLRLTSLGHINCFNGSCKVRLSHGLFIDSYFLA